GTALGELLGPSGLCLLESAAPSCAPQCPKSHHGHPDGKRAESGEHGGRGRGERTRRHEYEEGRHSDRHGCHRGGHEDPFSPPWKSHSIPFPAYHRMSPNREHRAMTQTPRNRNQDKLGKAFPPATETPSRRLPVS